MLLYVMKLMSNQKGVNFFKFFIENNLFLDFKLFIFKFFLSFIMNFWIKKKIKIFNFFKSKK